jgi:hypothetical protein
LVEELWFQLVIIELFFRFVVQFLGVITAMKITYKLFAYIFALLITGGCAAVNDIILESKDVQFLKVEELQTTPTRLKISGLAFTSAMSVSKITTKANDSAIVIQVHVALAKPGTSGSFAYELPVPESVKEVRFGTGPAPIWKRGAPPSSTPLAPASSGR